VPITLEVFRPQAPTANQPDITVLSQYRYLTDTDSITVSSSALRFNTMFEEKRREETVNDGMPCTGTPAPVPR
jgi:hypothetical protein